MAIDIDTVFARIDALNAEDPTPESGDQGAAPRDLLYGQRMSATLSQLRPDASPELRVACRAQHLGRHRVPRTEYPEGGVGYLRWRSELAEMHAERLSEILRDTGASDAEIARCAEIVRKKRLKADEDAQTLEDVACLVFLEHYAADFAAQHPRDKVIEIVQKTWRKMGARGRAAAPTWPMPEPVRAVVLDALEPATA